MTMMRALKMVIMMRVVVIGIMMVVVLVGNDDVANDDADD